MKPFCSGGTADIEILHALQDGELTRDEINPFYFAEPVAPLVAARKQRRRIALQEVVTRVRRLAASLSRPSIQQSKNPLIHSSCSLSLQYSNTPSLHHLAAPTRRAEVRRRRESDGGGSIVSTLLIEGSGGLLVPLGEGFTVADLIEKLDCEVIVVSRNRLGTINHTLLTVKSLQAIGIKHIKTVLMGQSDRDASGSSNLQVLAEWLDPVPVIPIPFLGSNALRLAAVKRNAKKYNKTLAQILA
jgi:dethiobiotin synthetase